MSNSVRRHRRQPTRLHPWDSPGKNTEVGCHFLFQCMRVKSESHSVVSDFQRPHGPQPTRLLHPWDFPGKSTGVGCHRPLRVLEQWLSNLRICFSNKLSHNDHDALLGTPFGNPHFSGRRGTAHLCFFLFF